MHRLTLTPPAVTTNPTQIVIGTDAVSALMSQAKDYEHVVVLFDEGVRGIAEHLLHQLPKAVSVSVPSGDTSKSLSEADRIVGLLLDAGCTRRSVIIAIGGGMLTDLGGFVASVFMRGVPVILVPTTLLGMVDAAIGGKTAVNAGERKNMIGTITHPASVIVDTSFLLKLPEAQMRQGLAEMIKVAAIADAPYFSWLETAVPNILKRDPVAMDEAVLRAVAAKVKIVEADSHDRDVRLLLNFGHTVCHAVEALSGFSIAHGDAVSIGVVAEMKIAGFEDQIRVEALLKAAGLPVRIPSEMKPDALWKLMLSDKKNENNEVRIAIPKHLGEGCVRPVSREEFQTIFS